MENCDLAPIVYFVYNRPWHTEQSLTSLMQNELATKSILYIFSDGPKPYESVEQKNKINEVRKIIRSNKWCKEVIFKESNYNKGLASSVIDGVTEVINIHEKVIVLEDDIITSKFFLNFINEALNFYENDKRIYSIGGTNFNFPIPKHYKYDVYVVHRAQSLGWGTWKDRWNKYEWKNNDFQKLLSDKNEIKKFNRGGNDLIKILKLQIDSKIDSWAILWDYHHYTYDAFCLYPIKSFTQNIGFDGSGTHCDNSGGSRFIGEPYLKPAYEINFVIGLLPDKKLERNFKAFYDIKKNYTCIFIKKVKKLTVNTISKLKKKKTHISLKKIYPYNDDFGFKKGTPIDRIYIEKFLEINSHLIKGVVLEVAESRYSKKFGKDVTSYEVLNFISTNNFRSITCDLTDYASVPSEIADCFICTQTLHVIYEVQKAIIGSFKLLKYGGVFLGTVAGISQISRYDMDRWGDYWRFTDLSIRRLFEEVFGIGNVEITTYGNVLAATAFLQGIAVEEIAYKSKLFEYDNNYQVIIGIKAIKK